jgi:hypothetical protein
MAKVTLTKCDCCGHEGQESIYELSYIIQPDGRKRIFVNPSIPEREKMDRILDLCCADCVKDTVNRILTVGNHVPEKYEYEQPDSGHGVLRKVKK